MSSLLERAYNPDVLTCLANLSNDEVFTPPELANDVLDMLPPEIWSDPTIKILDPCCKSGVFLREAAKRFIKGLEHEYPNLQERVDHIMHEQLFGIAITELTSLLSRRSLYCSKFPNGRFSVVEFDSSEGNIRHRAIQHTWENGRCKYCGASNTEYDRDAALESHAYELIHTDDPERIINMKFDVIVGNPPYQLSDGGQKASAIPLYDKFVRQCKKLQPKYLSLIIPARWYNGGRGLAQFRKEMLSDRHIEKLVDYPNSSDCFPGVDIAGGVCYFLWSRTHNGACTVVSNENGRSTTSVRALDEFPTFIRNAAAVSIIHKVLSHNEQSMSSIVSAQKPYGLRTFARPTGRGDVSLRWNGGVGPIERQEITSGVEWIDKWKVFTSYLTHDHAGKTDKDGKRRIISVLEVAPPLSVCTETYLSIGSFDSQEEAEHLAAYIRTKFVRFLVMQVTATQHLSRASFALAPLQDFKKSWTDESLFEKYGLTQEEIELIQSKISPMEAGD